MVDEPQIGRLNRSRSEFVRRTPDRARWKSVPAVLLEPPAPLPVARVWDEHDEIADRISAGQELGFPLLESRVRYENNIVDSNRRLIFYFADNVGAGNAGVRRIDRLARSIGGTCFRSAVNSIRRYEISVAVDKFPVEFIERRLMVVLYLINKAGLKSAMVPSDHLHLLPHSV